MARVVHFEIHAADPERAMRFYGEVFGWQFRKFNGPMDYWLIVTGPAEQRGIDGGLMRRMGGPPLAGQAVNAYVCTVDVPSIDASSRAALKHGATPAVDRIPIRGVGWLAYFKDTEGNIFGIMQADASAK
jgi:uncharacterized protein